MSIRSNLDKLLETIPAHVKLVAVSKTKPERDILEAYDAGQRIFGENKVQDLTAKQAVLPADIDWHFIGHMQRNKVKYIAPFIGLIHGVDSLKLLKEVNKQAVKHNRIIDCLLQFHIAEETTKFGLSIEEATDLLKNPEYYSMKNIRFTGVMGMSTFTDDYELVRKEFKTLKSIFDKLKGEFFKSEDHFKEISMGMSGDYQIAIEEGSTMVRIGTSIFGERNYP
jgi:hypothetical protein